MSTKKKRTATPSAINGDRATIYSSHPLYPALAHIAILERNVVQLRAQRDGYQAAMSNTAADNRDLTKANAALLKQIAKLTKKRK